MWQRVGMRRPIVPVLLLTLATVAAAACSDGDGDASSSSGSSSGSSTPSTVIESTTTGPEDAVLVDSLQCDPLDERACLLPWPNDAFTVPDPSTATGRRLDIHPDSPPSNVDGVPIDVTDQNRADGFSPGSAVLAFVPGLDLERTGIAPSTDIGASLADDAPVVLLDTETGERIPYWGELDAQAPEGDQVLMIRPAVSLPEGHRIAVAMRNLVDTAGADIEPTEAFLAALDGTPEPLERARYFRELFAELAENGITTDGLYLAWDFTVASADSLNGRALRARDLAYEAIADGAPAFTVDSQSDDGTMRIVEGTYQVPNFLSGAGEPGSSLLLDDDGLPLQSTDTPFFTAPYRCLVPLAPSGTQPTIVFGHGLLGTRSQVDGLSFAASAGLAGVCGTDEIGMSTEDLPNLALILADLSKFHQQADRMVQGLINQQFLGRLLNSPGGFASSPAFQAADGLPLVTVGNTVFVGNSQGGVLGGAMSAISTEWSRVVLGVPGVNYSLLLTRSSDWPEFQTIFDAAYTDPVDRVLALQLIQLLWDRGENNGYVQHLTGDTFPGVDPKRVLLVQAFGDHQVANVSTEVLARTIGAAVYEPALADGRSLDVDPQWNIASLTDEPDSGAVLVVWDWGTPPPPTVNLPPTEPEYGDDPHGNGSSEPLLLQQALTWLITGEFTDVCAGAPCQGTTD
ncbi:MAG: hypothetical protein RL238_3475 [Actinomycetota bacterium]|jgi:hypothetical protein